MAEQGANSGILVGNGIGVSVGPRYVLLDLDVALAPGEVLAIAGTNGAGKTTLLDVLAGRRRADRGEVRLHDLPLRDVAPASVARTIGVVGHLPGLYLDLDATENLKLFAALAGTDDDPARIAAILDQVGIGKADRRRPVRQYSRGMAQRTALGRLLAIESEVWLLDEPSTGLDRDGRVLLDALLQQARAVGRAVLVISHDDDLLAQADRALELRGGQLHPTAIRAAGAAGSAMGAA